MTDVGHFEFMQIRLFKINSYILKQLPYVFWSNEDNKYFLVTLCIFNVFGGGIAPGLEGRYPVSQPEASTQRRLQRQISRKSIGDHVGSQQTPDIEIVIDLFSININIYRHFRLEIALTILAWNKWELETHDFTIRN